MGMEKPKYSYPGNPLHRPRFRIGRILIPLVFAVVVLVILGDKIPAVHDAKVKLLYPEDFRARQACHAAALAAANQPAYARIISPGNVHETQGARYVEGVTIGEMGQGGGEVTFTFSCYVEPGGKIIKTSKQ